MIVSDLDIYRTAKVIIDGRGGCALYLANGRRGDCLDVGDREGAETWTRINCSNMLNTKRAPEVAFSPRPLTPCLPERLK